MLRLLAGGAADTDVLVATDDDVIIGHVMAGDRAGAGGTRLTEIGVVVADAYRGLGLGSALVRRMAARARLRGVTAVVMEVLAENRQVLTMIADHWQVAREDRSGAYITIWAPLPPEMGREEPWLPGTRRGAAGIRGGTVAAGNRGASVAGGNRGASVAGGGRGASVAAAIGGGTAR